MKKPPSDLTRLTRAQGVCIRWQWKWIIDGEPATRAVNLAIKRGDLRASYYNGGRASVNLTNQSRP